LLPDRPKLLGKPRLNLFDLAQAFFQLAIIQDSPCSSMTIQVSSKAIYASLIRSPPLVQ